MGSSSTAEYFATHARPKTPALRARLPAFGVHWWRQNAPMDARRKKIAAESDVARAPCAR
jgi:hypothetical protein